MCEPIDIHIDTQDLLDRLGDPAAELDRLLASIGDGPDLKDLLGTDAVGPVQIDRQEMRRRHLREARLLQRAGLRFFRDRGKKPPGAA
jgi:hypothetical protein